MPASNLFSPGFPVVDNRDRGQQHVSQQSFSSSPSGGVSQCTQAETNGLVQVTTAVKQSKAIYTLEGGDKHARKTEKEGRMRQQRCQRAAVPVLVAFLPPRGPISLRNDLHLHVLTEYKTPSTQKSKLN